MTSSCMISSHLLSKPYLNTFIRHTSENSPFYILRFSATINWQQTEATIGFQNILVRHLNGFSEIFLHLGPYVTSLIIIFHFLRGFKNEVKNARKPRPGQMHPVGSKEMLWGDKMARNRFILNRSLRRSFGLSFNVLRSTTDI